MSVYVSRILHAGYLLESENTRVVFDPLFESPFSRNCYSYPKITFNRDLIQEQRFDAVFISHYHDDHLSLESLNLVKRDTAVYIYCIHDDVFHWLKKMGFKHVTPLTLGSTVSVGPFRVTPIRALDDDVDCIFQIEVSGQKILNMVDSWMTEETLKELSLKSPWDLVLWPFQTFREIEILSPSRHNLSRPGEIPHEFEQQLRALQARYIVPSSCQFRFEDGSWLNDVYFPIPYSDFERFAKNASQKSQVLRMDPGERYVLDSQSLAKIDSLEWIESLTEGPTEYGVQETFTIPTTGQISQTFSPLTKSQRTKTLQFCTKGLLERFSKLSADEAPYFAHLRVWRLSVYDSNDSSLDFYFLIQGNNISLMGQTPKRFQWWTEIPLSRLYGALYEGESLSSLYVRINDCIFPQDIEDDIAEFDPMWDPLLRALYTGRFGTYQKAQLTRLLKS